MNRLFFVILLVFCSSLQAQENQLRPLAQAFKLMRAQQWDAALTISERDGQTAKDLILWHQLRAGKGTWSQVQQFLREHSDWPGLPYLAQHSEHVFDQAPPDTIVEHFTQFPPKTANGVSIYSRTLRNIGKSGQANETIQKFWINETLSSEQRVQILSEFGLVLENVHSKRAIELMWKNELAALKELQPNLPKDYQKLSTAFIALSEYQKDGVNLLINAIPNNLRNHPVIQYARFQWRWNFGYHERAIELLLEITKSSKTLGNPDVWAKRRYQLSRGFLHNLDPINAYLMLRDNHTQNKELRAKVEWLSGFIALRHLGDAPSALNHFENFLLVVDSPISLARGYYWIGRTHEVLNNRASAKRAFDLAAKEYTTFYGQLAMEKLNIEFPSTLSIDNTKQPWRTSEFVQSSVFQAAILLLAIDENSLGERFLTHLSESLSEDEVEKLTSFLDEIDDPHTKVMLGKRQIRFGRLFVHPYFALHPMSDYRWDVAPELMLSIARRESEFDQQVKSRVGAMGLMQIMPKTAQSMAELLNVPYDEVSLLTSWKYNALLGATYLGKLGYRYNGNPVLMAVAYNAGPTRADDWIAKNGDPRSDGLDIIDWIEMIPFDETRNYVMRVSESLPLYRARLGLAPVNGGMTQMLKGSAYLPFTPERK